MPIPPILLELSRKNPAVCNGLMLHQYGGASLEAAMAAIIKSLVETCESQHHQLLAMMQQQSQPTFFYCSNQELQ